MLEITLGVGAVPPVPIVPPVVFVPPVAVVPPVAFAPPVALAPPVLVVPKVAVAELADVVPPTLVLSASSSERPPQAVDRRLEPIRINFKRRMIMSYVSRV
jgi:hypothetical protein